MNAARDRPSEAAAVAELALEELKTATSVDQGVKDAIVGDAAALRLSRRVGSYPQYAAALKLLDDRLAEEKTDQDVDKDGRLHLLRALANGQKWHALPDAERQAHKTEFKGKIEDDLRVAFQREQKPDEVQPFWDSEVPRIGRRAPYERRRRARSARSDRSERY